MKKILDVIGQLGAGGAERQLIYLSCNLDKTIFEPIVCSFSEDTFFKKELEENGVIVEILPKRISPDLTRLFALYRVVKKYKPSIIHSYLFVGNTWARIVG